MIAGALKAKCPPEVLGFEDIVVGEPGDDEALIRNTVIGLNFVDVYYRRGGDHRIRSIKHGKGCNDHSMKRRRTRTRLQLVPETTGGRLVCGKELLFSWRCSHSRFTRETSSLPCF